MSDVKKEGKALPRYRVLQNCFIEPHFLYEGSVIDFGGPPGPHLYPLNAAAREKLELWYAEEHDEVDKDGKKTGAKVTPHEAYRFLAAQPSQAETYDMSLVRGPPKAGDHLSMAEAQAMRPNSMGDQRPPPAPFIGLEDDEEGGAVDTGLVAIQTAAPRPPVKSIGGRT